MEGFSVLFFLGSEAVWVREGTDSRMIRLRGRSSAPVLVVPKSEPLRPTSLYKAAARDVPPAL